jgi:4-amino-4-deoxy-L-arabinose transferase-like glycosyltransferase
MWTPAERRRTLLVAGGLTLVSFALYFLPALLFRPLVETPEARVAVVAREMLERGDWVVPTLGGEPRRFKPPLSYWLAALSAKAFAGDATPGETALTRGVLLPPAAASALTVFLLVIAGTLAFGLRAGAMAGIGFALSFTVIYFSQRGFVDTTLMFACALMLCGAAGVVCSPRPGVPAACFLGLGMGLAILVKEPIPFMVLGGPVVVEILLRRRFNARRVMLFAFGLLVAAFVALPWFVLLADRTPGGFGALIAERREMWEAGHLQDDRWVFYFYQLARGVLPWTGIWICALLLVPAFPAQPAEGEENGRRATERAYLRFYFLAAALGFLAFYLSPKQQDHYLLPLLPPLHLAAAYLLSMFRVPGGLKEEALAWTQLGLGLAVALAVATAPGWLHRCAQYGVEFSATVPAGVALLAIQFYLARQWVEGRPGRAVAVMGALALVGAITYSVHWTLRTRETSTVALAAAELRTRLVAAPAETRVYGVGPPAPILMFYLNRPVKSLEDLAEEPSDTPRPRLLIARRRDILNLEAPLYAGLRLSPLLEPGVGELVALSLPEQEDWPRRAREALDAAGLARAKAKDLE